MEQEVPRTPREGALLRGAQALRRDGSTIYAEELEAMLAELGAELDREHEEAVERELASGVREVAKPDVDDYSGFERGAVYSIDRARELAEVRRAHGREVGLDRFEVERPETFRDHAEEIRYHRSLELLRIGSWALPGRPGWRATPDGREWYSAEWL